MGSLGNANCCEFSKKLLDKTEFKFLDSAQLQASNHRKTAFLEIFARENVEKGLWVNDKLTVKFIDGRGYGLVAREPIHCGERLVREKALCIAPSHEELYQACLKLKDCSLRRFMTMSQGENTERTIVPRLDVDNDEAESLVDGLDLEIIKKIVQHNVQVVVEPPCDETMLLNKTGFGLWQVSSLFNHQTDNVCGSKFFFGDWIQVSAIRNIKEGEEICVSYCPVNMPWEERRQLLTRQHDFDEPSPATGDGKPMAVKSALDRLSAIRKEAQEESSLDTTLEKLKDLTNFCHQVGADPSFVDVYTECARVAELSGDLMFALQSCAMALELATVRQDHSVLSCMLSAKIAHVAKISDLLPIEDVKMLVSAAQSHFEVVISNSDNLWQIFNPSLAEVLRLNSQQDHACSADNRNYNDMHFLEDVVEPALERYSKAIQAAKSSESNRKYVIDGTIPDYHKVVASEPIKKHDVLLVEDPLYVVEEIDGQPQRGAQHKESVTQKYFALAKKEKDKFDVLYTTPVSESKYGRILGIHFTNNFSDGMYAEGARLNHSCNPNCHIGIKDDKRLVCVALRDISVGEELTHCYVGQSVSAYEQCDTDGAIRLPFGLMLHDVRIEELRKWFPVCLCSSCSDSTSSDKERHILFQSYQDVCAISRWGVSHGKLLVQNQSDTSLKVLIDVPESMETVFIDGYTRAKCFYVSALCLIEMVDRCPNEELELPTWIRTIARDKGFAPGCDRIPAIVKAILNEAYVSLLCYHDGGVDGSRLAVDNALAKKIEQLYNEQCNSA